MIFRSMSTTDVQILLRDAEYKRKTVLLLKQKTVAVKVMYIRTGLRRYTGLKVCRLIENEEEGIFVQDLDQRSRAYKAGLRVSSRLNFCFIIFSYFYVHPSRKSLLVA